MNPTSLRVRRVPLNDTSLVRRILEIHDLMPLEWDSSHRPSGEWVDSCLNQIETGEANSSFWILTPVENSSKILGIIWAKISTKQHSGRPTSRVCEIASLWVDSDLRGSGASRLLTQACLSWASENQITHIKCKTHSSNTRMRSILEKNHFRAEMIDYVLPFGG